MADQLATPEDLASFLQLGPYDLLPLAKQETLTMLIELATAKVQRAAGGQRILLVTTVGAVIDLPLGHDDAYVQLPQLPVRSVASVAINGTVVTDFYLRSQSLWRISGWSGSYTYVAAPPQLTVTYTHGHAPDSLYLQSARGYTLELARGGWGNPGGVTSEAIDDYRVTYAEAEARMTIPAGIVESLRTQYGANAYVTVSR